MSFNKKIVLIILILTIFIIPVSFAGENTTNDYLKDSSTDNTVYVDSANGNDNNGLGTPESPYKTIKKGIDSSSDGGVIKLNGTFRGENNYNLEITKNTANNLTFIGSSGTSINGMGGNYLFSITKGNATFINLTMFNAYKKGRGAAISITSGDDLLIKNVEFSGNIADFVGRGYGGAALYSSKGDIYIYNSTFSENEVKMAGNGGVIYLMNGANAYIHNSEFLNNTAYSGGVIYTTSDTSLIYINNSVFYANNVYGNGATSRHGGAIWTAGYVDIVNSNFISNVACGGGAIYSQLDSDNAVNINNSRFYYNIAAGNNGGAVLSSGGVNINNSRFIENSATDYKGSAVYAKDINVESSEFKSNTNYYALVADGKLNIKYSSLINNSIYGENTTADYNWWGDNTLKYENAGVYAVLTVNASDNLISQNTDDTVTINMCWNGTASYLNMNKIPLENITLTSTGGNLTENSLHLENGYAQTIFSSADSGTFTVSVTLNNETQSTQINVQGDELEFLYVSKNGNDSDSKNPFLTVSKAVEIANTKSNTIIYVCSGKYRENDLTVNKNITIICDDNVSFEINFTNNAELKFTNTDLTSDINNNGYLYISNATYKGIITNNGKVNITRTVINSSTITGGDDLTVNYCSVLNTTIYGQGNLDYNWWGTNSPSLNTNIYAVLNLTSGKNQVIRNETVNIYANVYWNGTSVNVEKIPLNSIIINDCNVATVNVSYTDLGNYTVFAKLDSQTVEITIEVLRKNLDTIYVSKDGNDNNEGESNSPLLTLTKAVEIAEPGSEIVLRPGTYSENDINILTDIDITGQLGVIINTTLNINSKVHLSELILEKPVNCNGDILITESTITSSVSNDNVLKITSSNLENAQIKSNGELTVNYCNIYNSQIPEDADIDYNWWGSNNPSIKVNVYAVLNTSANPLDMRVREISTITARMYWNGSDDSLDLRKIPNRQIIFSADGGQLLVINDTFTTYAYTRFNSQTAGIYNITVKVDDEIQYITITIPKEKGLDIVYANDTTGDDNNGDGSQTNPVKTIRKAIEIANDNATIYLTGEFKGEGNVNLNINVSTANNLTFIGTDDTVINGEYKNWLFEIRSSDATFTNISFINAYKEGFGAVIHISTLNTLTLNNVYATNNHAVNGGCGAALYGGYININGGEFTNNVASLRGGAVVALGHLYVNGTIFTSNRANTEGGAVYAGTVDLEDVQFILNGVHGSGGALFLSSTMGYSTVNSSVFIRNSATEEYGAGISTKANLIVENSEFQENTGFASSAIDNNGNLTVINCNFIENNATGKDAGAISNMKNTLIINATFKMNTAFRNGGAIKNQGDTLTVINSIFISNSAGGDEDGSYGGAVYGWNSTNTIINSTFVNNSAATLGGAIYASAGNGGVATLEGYGCVIINNTARIGSGLYLESTEGDFTNSAIIGNTIFSNTDKNMNYNWWGENSPDWTKVISRFQSVPEAYAVLNVTVSPKTIDVGDKSELIFKFNWNGTNAGGYIPERILSISAVGGDLGQNECSLLNPVKTLFTLTSANNKITAVVDGETFEYEFKLVKNTTLSVDVGNIIYGENANVNIKISPEEAVGDVVVHFNGREYNTTIKNGTASLILTRPDAGSYNIEVEFLGNESYLASNINTSFNVSKISDYDFNVETGDGKITVSLAEDATGNVTVNIDSKDYNIPVKDGVAGMTIPELDVGKYIVKITYSGDKNYNSKNKTSQITVDGVIINVGDVEKYYKGSERLNITLENVNGSIADANVTITINSVKYTRITDKDGRISMGLNLNSGKYNVTVIYGGVNADAEVLINPTVESDNLVKVFRNASQFYATFYDSNGNQLKNTNVTFNINGVFYTRSTNDKGIARLNINLHQGEYVITSTNTVTGENAANIITVLSKLTDNHDLEKFYKNGSQYTVRVVDDNGESAGAGVNVVFNINGVFYTRSTNDEGIATLSINLHPGEYIITAEYGDCRVSNNIRVKSVLTADDLKMNYRDGSKFEVKLVNGVGQAYSSQTVTFNVNGVFYNRITGADGIARLNINLQSGKYIITSTYDRTNIANGITIS